MVVPCGPQTQAVPGHGNISASGGPHSRALTEESGVGVLKSHFPALLEDDNDSEN